MYSDGNRQVFGKRSEPHTIIIARGDKIRHFTIRPWTVSIAGAVLAAAAIGYLVATSYLVMRDDLIGASVARQARMQQAYEDRISALRAQVDRITSRQLLDQQLMENKVSELLSRQALLSERNGILSPFVEKKLNATPPSNPPIPEPRPDKQARTDLVTPTALAFKIDSTTTGSVFSRIFAPGDNSTVNETTADRADRMFVEINKSLRSIEAGQIQKIRSLADDAYQTAEEISAALADAGLKMDLNYGRTGAGGPLVLDDPSRFEAEIDQLDEAIKALDAVRESARNLPIANPVPGKAVSSGFGMRRDPILGSRAYHSGMDFRAPMGFPVRSTGAGKVISAGWSGGYGRMVEIDHGHGIVTRYAHLKSISVSKGEIVKPGTIVGKIGSSGRSTGAHLHYEVRRGGNPINPIKFLSIGKKIRKLL